MTAFDHWWLSGVSVSGIGAMRPLVSYLDKARGHASDGHRSQRFGMSQTAIDVAIDAETNGVDGRDSRQGRVDPTVHCTCLINSFRYFYSPNVTFSGLPLPGWWLIVSIGMCLCTWSLCSDLVSECVLWRCPEESQPGPPRPLMPGGKYVF